MRKLHSTTENTLVAIKQKLLPFKIFENSSHWTVCCLFYEPILFEITNGMALHFDYLVFFLHQSSVCLMWIHLHACHCSYFIVVTLSLNQWRRQTHTHTHMHIQDDERFMSMNHLKIKMNVHTSHKSTHQPNHSQSNKALCEYTNDQKRNTQRGKRVTYTFTIISRTFNVHCTRKNVRANIALAFAFAVRYRAETSFSFEMFQFNGNKSAVAGVIVVVLSSSMYFNRAQLHILGDININICECVWCGAPLHTRQQSEGKKRSHIPAKNSTTLNLLSCHQKSKMPGDTFSIQHLFSTCITHAHTHSVRYPKCIEIK